MPNHTVPAEELQRLSVAVVKAHNLAEAGRVLTGYLHLYQGLMQVGTQTALWGPVAAKLWRQSLEEYKTAHPANWGELD